MILTLNPGCYGSIMCAQAESPTCQACPVKTECFEKADKVEPKILAIMTRKMAERGEGGAARVRKVVSVRASKTKPTAAKSGNARSDKLLQRYAQEKIDLSALRRGTNPFDVQSNSLHYHMAAFVMQGFPFKPKDMTEYVQTHSETSLSTASIKSEVARFASALVAAGILERKGTYILCLVV